MCLSNKILSCPIDAQAILIVFPAYRHTQKEVTASYMLSAIYGLMGKLQSDVAKELEIILVLFKLVI
jgi:hypothetical protein